MRTRQGIALSFAPQTAIALAAVFAAHAVAQDRPAGKPKLPEWLMEARGTMQVRGTYGLAFVLPESASLPTDELERAQWFPRSRKVLARMHTAIRRVDGAAGGKGGMAMWYFAGRSELELRTWALQALLMTADTDVKAILLDAVLLCGTAEQLGAKAGETLVLLDRFGRRVDGASVDFAEETELIASMRSLLWGGDRLVDRSKGASVGRLIADCTHSDRARSQRARAKLVAEFDQSSAAVAHARAEAKDPMVRSVLGEVIDSAYAAAAGKNRTQLLPFGMEWIERTGDACPPCGMARMPGPSRKFLSFLTR